MPEGKFRIMNSPFSLVRATTSVPTTSTRLPALEGAPSSTTRPDTTALPVLDPESAGESSSVRANSSDSSSPSEIGISAVTAPALLAWSVARIEFGRPHSLNAPYTSVLSRITRGVRLTPISFDTSNWVHAIDTSAPATGWSDSGSVTCPMTADVPCGRKPRTGQAPRMIVVADGTARRIKLTLSGPM